MNRAKQTQFLSHYRKSDGKEQSVKEHLEEVSYTAGAISGKIGLASIGELTGLLHDLGKYSDAFQTYIRSAVGQLNPDEDEYVDAKGMKGKIDHSTAGAQYIWENLQNKKELEWQLIRQIIALCVASHHTGLMDCLAPDGTDLFTRRMGKPKDRTHFNEVLKKTDKAIRNRAGILLASPTIQKEFRQRLELLAGGQSGELCMFSLGLLTRFLFSSLIDADRLSTADFENPTAARERYKGGYPDWAILIETLERHITGFITRNQIDVIRSDISSACMSAATRGKGLYTLTVPTGGGKTLASLRFALRHAKQYGMDRIIYVIPYTSIIDQNAAVVRSIFKDCKSKNGGRNIVLEHHSNLTPEVDTWQSKILAENWDAPIVFTTAVQFLETLFATGTRGARRMHQLANAIIIFDEIQTIPIRTVHLFNNAINFLAGQCGSTAVFCTATQPLLNEVDTKKGAVLFTTNHEMMPDVRELFRTLKRVDVIDSRKNGGWTENEVADCARQELERTGSVLIIVNTKKAAQDIYKHCREKADKTVLVCHLSTNMCPAHRIDVLKKIRECLDLENPKPVICVSTQLIEAGVDVDFGSVIRHLAGLDSIAQAAGRCNRNGLRATSRVYVVNPSRENLDMLPDIRIASEKAERVLEEYRNNPDAFDHDLLSPKAMAQYYRYYFFERAHEMEYPVGAKQVGRDDSLLTLLSTNFFSVEAYKRASRKAPTFPLRQSFRSAAEAFKAIDAPTEGVIVPYSKEGERIIAELCSAHEVQKQYELLKEAQRYSVNVFPNVLKKLSDRDCIHEIQVGSGIMYLDERYYGRDFGVSLEAVEQMKTHVV